MLACLPCRIFRAVLPLLRSPPIIFGVDLMKRPLRSVLFALACVAPLWSGAARADEPFPARQVYIAGNNVVGGTSSRCVHNGAFVLDPCDEFSTRPAACQAIIDVFNNQVLAAPPGSDTCGFFTLELCDETPPDFGVLMRFYVDAFFPRTGFTCHAGVGLVGHTFPQTKCPVHSSPVSISSGPGCQCDPGFQQQNALGVPEPPCPICDVGNPVDVGNGKKQESQAGYPGLNGFEPAGPFTNSHDTHPSRF